MNKGDEVVCIDIYGTSLDERIVYEVSNTSLEGKYITVYGYTKLYKASKFKLIKDYRKDKLLSALYDLKKYGICGPQKKTF